MELAPDGFKNLDGKVFNGTYPGPWIRESYIQVVVLVIRTDRMLSEACWGDDLGILS